MLAVTAWAPAGLAKPAQTVRLTAVLSRVEGNVTVQEAKPARRSGSPPSIRRAQLLQLVGDGDEIHVPAGTGAVLICSTDRMVVLAEGEQRLTPALCRAGAPLAPGAYLGLAARGGRLRSIAGVLVQERRPRTPASDGDEERVSPVLLYPRNTTVLEARPEIIWTQARNASIYKIQMEGEISFSLLLPAERIQCGATAAGEQPVCSMPYPTSQPELPPDALVNLRVTAGWDGTELHGEQRSSWVRRLRLEQSASLSSQIEAIRALPLGEDARLLLEGDLCFRNRFYARAIDRYREAQEALGLSEVRVALGDTYLMVGLITRAGRVYREALNTDSRSDVRAAALLGLGWVEMARRRFGVAREHFEEACQLYTGLHLDEEAAVARRAAEEAKEVQ